AHRRPRGGGPRGARPPALRRLVGPDRAGVELGGGARAPVQHPALALLAGAVTAAGGVDRDAVPARGVEQGDPVRHPHPPRARLEDQVDPYRAVRVPRSAGPGGHAVVDAGHGAACAAAPAARPSPQGAPAAWAAACWARCAAIQDAPQESRSSSRSAALTARTICGARASMIALVRPCDMATGRNAAPIVCRSGMPNDTFEAPSVMFTPNSSR